MVGQEGIARRYFCKQLSFFPQDQFYPDYLQTVVPIGIGRGIDIVLHLCVVKSDQFLFTVPKPIDIADDPFGLFLEVMRSQKFDADPIGGGSVG